MSGSKMERQEKVRTLELHHSHFTWERQTEKPTKQPHTANSREMEKTRNKKIELLTQHIEKPHSDHAILNQFPFQDLYRYLHFCECGFAAISFRSKLKHVQKTAQPTGL